MSQTLGLIPVGAAITDRAGTITTFFRLRWEELRNAFQLTPTVGSVSNATPNPTAAVTTVAAYTTKTSGRFRVSAYLRKTIPDGVSSSLQLTIGWTESGVAQTRVFAALTLDTTLAEQDSTMTLRADATTDITYAIGYASNTPHTMAYVFDINVEQFA